MDASILRGGAFVCGLLFTLPVQASEQGPATGMAGAAPDSNGAEARGAAEAEKAPDSAWGDLHLAMFVDAYAAWQTGGKGTLATLSGHRAFSGQGATYRSENGFSLAFLGFDAQYDVGRFGAVASLRLGPGASIFHRQSTAESDFSFGVDHLTQAYAVYRPVDQVELDLGMFMSPFGAESLDSWKNPNYTISALYVYGQPSWHTGLQAKWELDSGLTLMALIVNGTNNVSETQQNGGLDQAPTVGGSLSYAASPALSFGVGGLWALNGRDNDDSGVDGFVDLVSSLKLGELTVTGNGDFIFTRGGAPGGENRYFWGGSLTGSYRINDAFGVAARGEYLHDDANYGDGDIWKLVTGTLTLDVRPVPKLPNLVVRWENRWERSNQHVFGKDARGTVDTADDTYARSWFETVIGVVVTTAP